MTGDRTDMPHALGCYRRGDRWECYTCDDLTALLRLSDDGLPVEVVDDAEQEGAR